MRVNGDGDGDGNVDDIQMALGGNLFVLYTFLHTSYLLHIQHSILGLCRSGYCQPSCFVWLAGFSGTPIGENIL